MGLFTYIYTPRATAMEKSAMGLSENDHEAISLGYISINIWLIYG